MKKLTTLFHGTNKCNLEQILKNGLDPEFSQSSLDAVFLAISADATIDYMCMHGLDLDDWVVLAIDFSFLDESKLGPDNYELRDLIDSGHDELEGYDRWYDVPWELSLSTCGQVAYEGVIPAKAIAVHNTDKLYKSIILARNS